VVAVGGSLTKLGFNIMYEFRPSTRRLRHIVWLTLLAWLFALTAGVVNACVLSMPDRVARELNSAQHAESALHMGGPHTSMAESGAHFNGHETAATAQHEHGQDADQDSCLKFCNDEATALSKDKSSGSDMTVALAEADTWCFSAAPIMSAGGGLSRERPTSRGPPLVIRFLRLTL
jgi:hypothetical protein